MMVAACPPSPAILITRQPVRLGAPARVTVAAHCIRPGKGVRRVHFHWGDGATTVGVTVAYRPIGFGYLDAYISLPHLPGWRTVSGERQIHHAGAAGVAPRVHATSRPVNASAPGSRARNMA